MYRELTVNNLMRFGNTMWEASSCPQMRQEKFTYCVGGPEAILLFKCRKWLAHAQSNGITNGFLTV